MIRLSTLNDINDIVTVWKEAFGDSEKDIRFFLDAHFKDNNTVVYDFNGEVVSVLFLIDGDMHINGVDYSSYYLYAACTLKKYRGRGIMAEMLDFARRTASERNKFFITLKPAEETLYNYYYKFGYQPSFSKKILSHNKTVEYVCPYSLHDNNNLLLFELRNKSYENFDYFKWSNSSIEFAIKHHEYYGGKFISDCNGYMLYSINNDVLRVKENTFSPDVYRKIINDLAENHRVHKVSIELPVDYDFNFCDVEIIKSGMILPLSKEADRIIKNVNNAYLALTLD